MMRNCSNLYLTAVLGGLTVSVLLLGAIRARNERPMKVLTATLALAISSPAAAQECQTCLATDSCVKEYSKAASEAQRATKQAIRDWKQNLDRKASAELSSRGTVALQDAMETQVRSELERLKECLAKIR
jgi:hypothetical protein